MLFSSVFKNSITMSMKEFFKREEDCPGEQKTGEEKVADFN